VVKVIQSIEAMGIKTAMITGDNERTAKAIGYKAGISHVISDVLPSDKVNEIKSLQKQFGLVAMVGDGINDAPALKQANVGIAIGSGTDVAIEAADVTLVNGNVEGVLQSIRLSKAIFRKIKENFFWAWFYNGIAIPFAILGLLHPMIGAAAMSLSSINVIYNSLRLKKLKL
jgi:Cu+-exporting ATPase